MAYFVFLLHETNASLYTVINVNPVEKIRDNNKKKLFVSAQTKTMMKGEKKWRSDTIMPLYSYETALASNWTLYEKVYGAASWSLSHFCNRIMV